MIHFKREYVDKTLSEELDQNSFKDYWKETTAFPDMELHIRWEQYFWMQEQGSYYFYTARTDDNDMVGYVGYIVTTTMHWGDDVVVAASDLLYMEPAWRGQGVGSGLIEAAGKDLEANGVDIIQHHVSEKVDYTPLLEKMGYIQTDRIYSRRVG